ncbi:uncharacterized protein LOC126797371 [Argentina anserina]|uniref:uncharacterized protein LOC126797371 n=1 Tax=Argentina anserina TaxID=57926 RepID=UPI0021768260|nr:uncharacterized protein LOC126797371 [Potentilla anserina]
MATDEYKLVFFEPKIFAAHIFLTKDNSWKIIGAPHSSFPHESRPLLVSNGACHGVVRYGVSKQALHAFILVEEEFRQLPLPLALMAETALQRWVGTQVLIGGGFCVWSRNQHGYAEFWEMKEYGVPESWVKLFHFRVHDIPDVLSSEFGCSFVSVTEGGAVLVSLGDKELVRIECHREEKPVCSGRCKIPWLMTKCDAMVYGETLLSV